MTKVNIEFVLSDPLLKRKRPLQDLIKTILHFILSEEIFKQSVMDVSFVDEKTMCDLNHQYRHKNYPTNILSFQDSLPLPGKHRYLGSLILCLPVLKAEALAQHKSLQDHLTHLLVHGCLHLLGYNHEKLAEASVMESLEIDILKKMAIGNPYE